MSALLQIFKKDLWTKPLSAWYLYDFANSFIFINATIYFSQWVVVDNKIPDFWLALPFMVATAILVFLSPYLGNYGDRKGAHYKIFLWTNLGAAASAFLIFFAGRVGLEPTKAVIIALVFYAFYQFFYQLAFVPYSVFIKFLSPSKDYGKVSGIGFGFSELGHIAGLLLTLPIIYRIITIFGVDRLATMFPAAIGFILFALPALVILKSKSFAFNKPVVETMPEPSVFKSFWENIKKAREYPGVLPLIISFYFFSDAIVTITFFSAIYLQNVFAANDAFIVNAAILVIVGWALGAFIGGALSDRWSHRKVLVWSLVGNAAAIAAIALARDLSFNLVLFPFFGVVGGAAYASSRSYLASLIPEAESGRFFGLYAFAERFASIVGPLVWGLITWSLASYFPLNYRAAVLAMAILVVIGIIPFAVNNRFSEQQSR